MASDTERRITEAYERVEDHDRRKPHAHIPVQVWADVDEGIAVDVAYLNTIDGVRTFASCQGTLGEGGPHPYRANIMAQWPAAVIDILKLRFQIDELGKDWGYLYPIDAA